MRQKLIDQVTVDVDVRPGMPVPRIVVADEEDRRLRAAQPFPRPYLDADFLLAIKLDEAQHLAPERPAPATMAGACPSAIALASLSPLTRPASTPGGPPGVPSSQSNPIGLLRQPPAPAGSAVPGVVVCGIPRQSRRQSVPAPTSTTWRVPPPTAPARSSKKRARGPMVGFSAGVPGASIPPSR